MKIYNVSDEYEYSYIYESFNDALQQIKQYEKEDLQERNNVNHYQIVENDLVVFDSLAQVDQLLAKIQY